MNKSWIPCLLTILNLLCGMFAMIFLLKGNVPMAAGMFFTSSFFDTIDGKVARYLNAVSELGKELDSLSDLVSFGIVPALFLYQYFVTLQTNMPVFEFVLPAIFAVCGALRLARYNVLNIKDHFLGVPIPVAGGLLILTILIFGHFSYLIVSAVSLMLAALMVSNFKFPRLWV